MSKAKPERTVQSQVWVDKLADVQTVADKLADLPQEALLYIAGYAEGFRDRPKGRRKKPQKQEKPAS